VNNFKSAKAFRSKTYGKRRNRLKYQYLFMFFL
jgi:hypothetical protein